MQTIIDNCDTFITMGGNDFSTAEMIARRADRPLTDIQNMSVSTKWVFQRRWKPVFSSTADLDGYDLPRQIEASLYAQKPESDWVAVELRDCLLQAVS